MLVQSYKVSSLYCRHRVAPNGLQLGEVAGLEALTFN